jgi:DUF3102 family protein
MLAPAQTSTTWAERIAAAWSRSAEAIIETGKLLIEAKAALPHGEWESMAEKLLPFPLRTAQRLMEIGRDQRLVKASILPLLPDRWTRIHKLHKLDDATFERRLLDLGPIGGARSIMSERHEPDDSLDYFPTPPWATRALIERVFDRLGVHGLSAELAWEPACGEGHIAEVLTEYFAAVSASDVFDYGYGSVTDFLAQDHLVGQIPQADWIITNPPFNQKALEFVDRALALAPNVAMFFRSQWAVEGIDRYERLFRDRPPTLCAFFVERVNLWKGQWVPDGTTATAYCWLIWIKGRKPLPTFWIPPGCQGELSRPDDAERFITHPVTRRAA